MARPAARLAGRQPPRGGRLLVPAGVVAVTGLAAAGIWLGSTPRPDVLLNAGTAWLASAQGLVTLLDGPSEQVIGNVRTQVADGAMQVVQTGASALVVDGVAGTVSRIDGATYDVTGPVPLGTGSLDVLTGGGRTVVVDPAGGRAVALDGEDLAVQDEIALDAAPGPGQSVVDRDGVLWVVDGAGGGVSAHREGADPVRADVGDAASQLVTVQGRAVMVDLTGERAGWLEESGEVSAWSCLDLPPGDGVRLLGATGSPRVFAAVPGTRQLTVADLGQEECADPVDLGPTGMDLGRLVQAGGFVLIPDVASGQAVIVEPDAGEVVGRPDVVASGTPFELRVQDGLVFYNEVQGERAGLLHVDGGVWTAGPGVRKYSTAPSEVLTLAGADTGIAPEALPPPPTDTPVQPTETRPSVPTTSAAPTTAREPPGGPTQAGTWTSAPPTPDTSAPATTTPPAAPTTTGPWPSATAPPTTTEPWPLTTAPPTTTWTPEPPPPPTPTPTIETWTPEPEPAPPPPCCVAGPESVGP